MSDDLRQPIFRNQPDNRQSDSQTIRALVIPADPSRRITVTQLERSDQIRELVGGDTERATYDRDAEMWVNDTGRIGGQEFNLRASKYVLQDSEAANRQQGRVGPGYGLYGDVVVTGTNVSSVPERMVKHFSARQQQEVAKLIEEQQRQSQSHGHRL